MATGSIRTLAIVSATLVLSTACGSQSPSGRDGAGHRATGKVVATGAFDFTSQRLGVRTKIAKEPYQETFALRLAFVEGNDLYRGLLVDIDDLPAEVDGSYSLGDGVDADLNFLASDPNQSGPRFLAREGQLEIRVSNGRASGTLRGLAEMTSFAASDASLEIQLEFDAVLIEDPEP